MKLAVYLSKPDHSLQASVVASPNECELGKWIHSEGQKYSNIPEFAALVSSHASFHTAAGEVVRKADAGQNVAEEIVLGANSEFAATSTAVVRSIMAMKSKL
jgi:methyl-accepting chemotaxis protein